MDTEIFSNAARRVRRHHVWRACPDDRWLLNRMWAELQERIGTGKGRRVLLIGHDFDFLSDAFDGDLVTRIDPGHSSHWGNGLRCEEDQLMVEPESYDLVLACGTLDSLHDVPGALLLARHALKPDGRFHAAFFGSGSLPLLRSIVQQSEDVPVARMHPQIDVRAGGDLLTRAGFSDPVADTEEVLVRYPAWGRYMADLRANGIGNCLRDRYPATRGLVEKWRKRFEAQRDGAGRATEIFGLVYLSATARAATIS